MSANTIKRPYNIAPVAVSATEKEAIEAAAKALGLTVADTVRSLPRLVLESLKKEASK